MLLLFANQRINKPPCALQLEDLDAQLVSAFLEHLEVDRHNGERTRNARLAAIHSLFRFAALRHPDHAELIQRVLAIPSKRSDRAVVCFLTPDELDALLDAPDRSCWLGRRDYALLLVAAQTGLRVSELTVLCCSDVVFGVGAHIRCTGKGRKQRVTPLTQKTASLLMTWMKEREGGPGDPLFPTRQGRRLSRFAVTLLVTKHANTAAQKCPSLKTKKVSPHVLRHTAAMRLLHAGIDTSVIALFLGQEVATTHIYMHADLALKERALARTAPPNTMPGRYRPSDSLLAFLEEL